MKKIKKPVSLLLSMILIFSLFTIVPVSAAETGDEAVGATKKTVEYIENDGDRETKNCVPFTKDTKILEAGEWYYAEGNISNWNRVTARHNTHLILLDGATCYFRVGINVPTHVEGQKHDGSLHIYAQSTDKDVMGKLIATTTTGSAAIGSNYHNYDAGHIEINGGYIEAQAKYGAAIGSGEARLGWNFLAQEIVINGGYIHAVSTDGGCGIGSGFASSVGKIQINGGTIIAESAKGAGIGAANNDGYEKTSCGTIEINGGDITAIGALNAIGANPTSADPWPGYTENYTFDGGKIVLDEDMEIVTPLSGRLDSSKKFIVDPAKFQDQTKHATYVRLVEKPTYHDINLDTVEHGTVTRNRNRTVVNDTVTLSVSPDPGYAFGSLTVKDDVTDELIPCEDEGSGKYTFTMPDHDVTVSAEFTYKTPAEYWAGSGTATDPYIIATNDDWTVLTTAYDYYNDHFKLGGNISVTAPVGDLEHPFKGVFDGDGNDGKKLMLDLSSSQGYFAPFIKTDGTGTVIKNLLVTGDISFAKKFGSALVAQNSGNLTIENCRVDATLTSTINGEGSVGGFVGENQNDQLTITGCVFSGELLGSNTTKCGGFIGLSTLPVTINDSAFVPLNVTFKNEGSATFVCDSPLYPLICNARTFYNSDFGATKQGHRGHFVTCTPDIELDFVYYDFDPQTTGYSVSGIDTFGDDNIMVDGKYMANDEEDIDFKIKKPDNYIVGNYTYARVGVSVDHDLEIYDDDYYQIDDVKTDISVSALLTHRLLHHPAVAPGVNHYGYREYWECTMTDCNDVFSDKNAENLTSMEELKIPPTNICKEETVFAVGEDIFFPEGAQITCYPLNNLSFEEDTVGVVRFDSDTNALTLNGVQVNTVNNRYEGKEFTGELYVIKRSEKFQIFPLYHKVNNAPSWDWNGHYSAEATLTGFAYYYSDWVDVDHTQTIDAPITYTDAEAPDEYAAPERTYTATAVTPGVTFYDSKTEELSPQYHNIEGGKIYSIDDQFRLQNPVKIKNLQNEILSYSENEALSVNYDKESQRLLLSKDNDTHYSPDAVAEIQNEENNNFTFTGYFFVVENTHDGYYVLIPIYHGNYGDQGVSWTWSEDKRSAEVTVNHNWFIYDSYYKDFTEPFSVTKGAEVTLDMEDGTAYYRAHATLCDCEFDEQQIEYIAQGTENLAGYSISLDGDIGVNFYMELTDKLITDRNVAYMQFTVPSGDSYSKQRMFVSDAKQTKVDGKTYYIFKCKVAAKDMASKVTAQMIDGNDVYNMYSYSVRDYAEYLLNNQNERETYRTAAPLVIAMLNYGAAAQRFFGVNTDDLANSILAEEDIIYREFTVDEMEVPPTDDTLPEGVFEGASLSLKSQTTLSIYFKSDQRLTFSCDGMTVEKDEADGYQIARIRNIPAVNLSDTFTLTVNGLGTVTYSPLNYCKNVLTNAGTGSRQKDVAGALYTYSYLADYYFGKKQPAANEEPAD